MKWFQIRVLLFSLGVATSLGGGLVWHAYSPTIYEARAGLVLPDERPVAAFRDPELIARARERLKQKWPAMSAATGRQKTPAIAGKIDLTFQLEGNQLAVRYQTPNSKPAVEELNALLEQFLEDQKADVAARRQAEADHERRSLQLEGERIAAEQEKHLQVKDDLQYEVDQHAAQTAQQATSLEQIRTVSKALTYAKLSRVETEQHLRVVEQSLNEEKSLGMIVSKLPEGRVREFLQGILEQQRLQTELEQNRNMRAELAAIYGRQHPRLKEIDGKIALLAARQSSASLPSTFTEKEHLAQTSLILQTVQGFLQQARGYEEELRLQLEREQSLVDARSRVDRELEGLSGRMEQNRLRAEEIQTRLAQLNQQPPESPIVVTQSPWLLPQPISMKLETLLLISLGPGILLGLLFNALWHHRPRLREAPRHVQRTPAMPTLNERRLMRMHRQQAMRM